MDALTRGHWQNIPSSDREIQGAAYSYLLEATARPVAWAYDVWDDLVGALTHKEGRTRSIAAQLLCNLAKGEPGAGDKLPPPNLRAVLLGLGHCPLHRPCGQRRQPSPSRALHP